MFRSHVRHFFRPCVFNPSVLHCHGVVAFRMLQQQQENSRKPFLRYQKPPSARFAIMCFAFLSFTAMALGSFWRYIGVCFLEVLDSPCHCVLLFSRVATTQLLQQDCFRVVKGSNNTWCASLSLWNLFFLHEIYPIWFLFFRNPEATFGLFWRHFGMCWSFLYSNGVSFD